jgi:transcription elongation GreA/GreB family factor
MEKDKIINFGVSLEATSPGEDANVRNQRIRALLKADMLPVLPFEKTQISEQIEKVKREQDEMGKELGEVNHQGSETWHDNFAANNIQRNSVVVSKRGHMLAEVQSSAVELDYPDDIGEITLGSIVVLMFGDEDKTVPAMLTGFASDSASMGPTFEGITLFTVKSPLGARLLGARAGEVVDFEVNGDHRTVRVVSVEQFDPNRLTVTEDSEAERDINEQSAS